MTQMWIEYRAAYRDCSEWLAQVFLPWRWVVVFHEQLHHLRTTPLVAPPRVP